MSISNQFSKIPKQEKTIFSIIAELADQYNAVDLSNGHSDFTTDPNLIELVNKHMKNGLNQYAAIEGLLKLRQLIAEQTNKLYETNYDATDELSITNGANEAIFATITAFIREKDEVIIFEPTFNAYAPAVKINGGIPVFIDMKSPKFQFDWDKVQLAITANTRMIIINNPHNPTGTTMSAWDMEKLKKVVNGTNILILSDEVYKSQVYDGIEHESLANTKALYDRSIIINSLGKIFNVNGWRLGYVIGPKPLMNEFRKVHQFSMFTANTPIQHAFADYLENFNSYNDIVSQYQQKRDLFFDLLKDSKYKLKKSKGTLFQCIDFSEVSDESDFEFASRLIREYKVATVPLSYFYKAKTDNKILRLNFAKSDELLKLAAESIIKASQ